MNSNEFSRLNYDGKPTKEYDAHEVEKQYRSHAALLSQTTALIFLTVYIFLLFLPSSQVLKMFEVIVSGIILSFSALAILFVVCQSWENSTTFLRVSLMFLLIFAFAALYLDALDPLSEAMFDLSLTHNASKFAKIIVLMLLPITLFPSLFLNNGGVNKSNVRALWFFVVSVIPLLLLRILGMESFIS